MLTINDICSFSEGDEECEITFTMLIKYPHKFECDLHITGFTAKKYLAMKQSIIDNTPFKILAGSTDGKGENYGALDRRVGGEYRLDFGECGLVVQIPINLDDDLLSALTGLEATLGI
jgi:hypothetical protein